MATDYATMYQKGLRAFDPETGQEVQGVLDPNKRYNLQFYHDPTEVSTASPQYQQATQADRPGYMQSQFEQAGGPKTGGYFFEDTNDQVNADYNASRMRLQNEFLERTKPLAGLANTPQGMLLMESEAMRYKAEEAKLMRDKEVLEAKLNLIDRDQRLSTAMKTELKAKAHSESDVYKVATRPRTQPEVKPVGSPLQDATGAWHQPMMNQDSGQVELQPLTLPSPTTTAGDAAISQPSAVPQPLVTPAKTGAIAGEKIVTAQQFLNDLKVLKKLYSKKYVGPIKGRWRGLKEATVGLPQQEVEFRQLSENLADLLLRIRSGAQTSEPELQRIRGFLPTANLPAATFEARLKGIIKQVERQLAARQAMGGGLQDMAGSESPVMASELAELEAIRRRKAELLAKRGI